MHDTHWSYLAGLLDGEGCITSYTNGHGSYYVRIRMGQKDPFVLEYLRDTFGGSIWFRESKTSLGVRPLYTWGVESGLARTILKETYPYLKAKKPQAKVALHLLTDPRPPKDQQLKLHKLLSKLKQVPVGSLP